MGCSSGKNATDGKSAKGGASGTKGTLLDKYALGAVLGQGAFGVVYSCKSRATKVEYAVKMIDKVETEIAEIELEVKMLTKYAHPSVVKLHDVFYDRIFVCMVLDLHKGGDLIEGMQVHWKSAGMLPLPVVANLVKQMFEGVNWLHKNSVIHRDVKGDNYLMDRKDVKDPQCRIFLSDFGTVKEVKEGERIKDKCGTKNYWPPELYNANYSFKVDVWAVGVVMYGAVCARFPFKDQKEVMNKPLQVPSRCCADSGLMIKKLLERKEADRFTADQAVTHPFLKTVTSPSEAEQAKTAEMNFSPEVKESGANAGIAERRFELIERLEKAHLRTTSEDKSVGAQKSLKEFKEQAAFTVTDRQVGKTTLFEWWSADKAKELTSFPDAKPLQDNAKGNAETGADEIRKMLEDQNIDTSAFGKGQARTLEELADEIRSGSSRLMLDATKCRSLVRVLDVVLLRIKYKSKDGEKYLVTVKEQFPDGRVKPDVNQLPGAKKEPYENAAETTKRIVQDRLRLVDCKLQFDFHVSESFEEDEDSPSFPGLRTVYRKEVFEGEITTTDKDVLSRIGATGSNEWSAEDSTKHKRTFHWLDRAQCQTRRVKLGAVAEHGDVSALVQAPVGMGEDELTAFLEKNSVDISKFGEGPCKSIKEFSSELVKGEAELLRQADGTLLRVVDVVVLVITNGTDVLVEVEEDVKGSKKALKRLPATKRRPDGNMFLAAHEKIDKVLKVNNNFITLNPKDVRFTEERKQTDAYGGISTLYRKRIVLADVLKGDSSCSVCI